MSVSINNLNIQPGFVVITCEQNRSYGRRFKVENCNNGKTTTVTMKQLYQSAHDAYKANIENKAALADLKVYVQGQIDAEKAAKLHYADAGCWYDFRTLFHRLFGGTLFVDHEARLNTLMTKLNEATSATPTTPVQPKSVSPWENANSFTEKVYQPLPVPKKFEGTIVSNHDFENLLTKHAGVLDSAGQTTHGKAIDNLRDAFYRGKGKTIGGGISDFVDDVAKNRKIHRKVQEVLTLVSQQKAEAQLESMYKLSIAFVACNTGRINVIEEMHDSMLFNNTTPDFEGRVRHTMFSHKQEMFNRLIREKSNPNGPSHMQFPHMSSGYLAVVGAELGLSGIDNANTDPHKYNVSDTERRTFIAEFKGRFSENLDDLIISLANEINDAAGPFHPVGKPGFGQWIQAKGERGLIDGDFAYYDAGNKYSGLKEPTKKQKDNAIFYVSNAEVKHILGMLDYLQ